MTDEAFIQFFCDAIDLENTQEIQPAVALKEIPQWDSLALLNLLAAADADLNIELKGDEIADCKTLADIKKLIESK